MTSIGIFWLKMAKNRKILNGLKSHIYVFKGLLMHVEHIKMSMDVICHFQNLLVSFAVGQYAGFAGDAWSSLRSSKCISPRFARPNKYLR